MTARKLRLREAAIATTRFFMETRTVTKPVLMEIKAFLMADATFTKNVLKANTTARKPRLKEATIATTRFFMETKVATKPFVVANTTARKPRLRENVVKTIRFPKPVLTETTNLIVEARSFEKKVAMETPMVIKPVLMETKNFVMAPAMSRRPFCREVIIAWIKFTNAVFVETASFTVKDRLFEKNAVIEARTVKIPVLIETRSFLMAVNSIRGKENDAREGPAATTTPSGFNLTSGRRMEVSLITGTTPSLSPGSA